MAVAPLAALVAAGFEVATVITGEDKRRGRGGRTTPTPVKQAALDLGLPVAHDPAAALEVEADLGVVVAFGQILRRPFLERLACLNLHFSLLPRWRGAAPVERALLAGDERTGVCVMAVEEGLDTGAVYARSEVPIRATTTAAELSAQLSSIGSTLLVETLTAGLADPVAQSGEPTYARKLSSEDLHLDWSASAAELDRVVRVGGAWTTFRGRRLKVLAAHAALDGDEGLDPSLADPPAGSLFADRVACGTGWLVIRSVQPEGKAPVDFDAWRNGARPLPGERFGAPPADGPPAGEQTSTGDAS